MSSEANLFANASNVHIQGSTFTIQTLKDDNTKEGVMERLLKAVCFSALLDSQERSDPPRCSRGTRVTIIRSIIAWITRDVGGASLLWVHGPAGGGKTAIAQTVSEICREDGHYCGGFFFSRISTAPGRSNGDSLIPTLLYQLLLAAPQLQFYVHRALDRNPGILHLSKETQMEALIVKPVIELYTQAVSDGLDLHLDSRLIVIDGLDECSDEATQRELLGIITRAVFRLPLPFRFLISSRPEFHIRQFLENKGNKNMEDRELIPSFEEIDLSKDRSIDADIRQFLTQGFNDIRRSHPIASHLPFNWPRPRDIHTLIVRSCGHFIYVATAMKYIACHDHRPDDRLQVVLGLSSDPEGNRPFDPLDTLYRHLFSSVKPQHLKNVLRLFGLIYLQNKSNPKRRIHGIYAKGVKEKGKSPYAFTQRLLFERMLGLRPGDIELMMKPLLSIFEFWPYPVQNVHPPSTTVERRMRITHASVFDFLLDHTRSKCFHLDLSSIHQKVATYFLKHIPHEDDFSDSSESTAPPSRRRGSTITSRSQVDNRLTISSISLVELDFLVDHLTFSPIPFNIATFKRTCKVIEKFITTINVHQWSTNDMDMLTSTLVKYYTFVSSLSQNDLCCNLVQVIEDAFSVPMALLWDWEVPSLEVPRTLRRDCCQMRLYSELTKFKCAFAEDNDEEARLNRSSSGSHFSDVFDDHSQVYKAPAWESLPAEGGYLASQSLVNGVGIPCTL